MSYGKAKMFKATGGYDVASLLHYGFDNLAAAELLLRSNARYFDSAGYLAQLGIELLLKAWHLHLYGQFENNHNLEELWRKLKETGPVPSMTQKELSLLKTIDSFYKLRYPNPSLPQEIGSDDLEGILRIEAKICTQMPKEMHRIIDKLNGVNKGGRILAEREVGDERVT